MCIDLDLFGEVIVSFSDVELWLENSRYTPDNIPSRVKGYIKDYDIARKIREAKLSGEFYKLEPARYGFDQDVIRSAFISYKEPAKETSPTGCPLSFHICKHPQCEVFQKRKKRDYNRAHNAKKKADRAAWLAAMATR